MADVEGFYAAYMTGVEGQGFAMLASAKGKIVGVDPLGVQFDGIYTVSSDGGSIAGEVTVSVPSGGVVIQGASAGPAGITYVVPITIPIAIEAHGFFSLDTPLGPVNIKLKRLRDLGGLAV